MCQWLSAIVTKSGELYFNPWVSSHETLIRIFNLRDTNSNLARVEYFPKGEYYEIDKYGFKIDEERKPTWLNEEKLIPRLRRVVEACFIKQNTEAIAGGVFIP